MREAHVATTSAGDHSDELAEFGYKQELDRSIGRFASFAAGVSYISILTGVFQLFYFGFAFGGPAYWWTWPMVFVGQLMVALCFAELAANFPVAGSIYNWGKMLASATVAWLGGWMMLTASIVTIAAVALAYQITLPEISDFFWFYGDGSGDNDFAINAVILGTVLIAFTTLINALGVKLMSRINSTGVFIELIAAVVLIVALLASATRGPDVVFETQGTGEGHDWGYFGAFLAASLASAYVMYGFDTASSLGEETHEPRKTAPKAILRAVIASFVLGGLIILFAMMAVGNIGAPEIGQFGGLQYIILDVFGNTVGKIFLICVVIAVTVCCLAVHTATIRMAFAMARDNNLPAGERVATVHPKTKTPIVPAVITGLLAILILVVNIGNDQIFTVITSIGIIMIYMAYLLVTVPMLLKRLRGEWPPKQADGRRFFTLGKWGLPINLLAVGWGFFMAINLAWPRKDVYNATEPFHWYLQYGAILFIGIVFFGGLAYYWFVQRHKTGVLESHRFESASPAVADTGAVPESAP
jgi:urea carboxylase system permease